MRPGRWMPVLLLVALLVACGGGGGGGDSVDPWRSALFPDGWTPALRDAAGRYLPDVSYAGYKNGEASLPDLTALPVVNVVTDHGADPTGATDATAAFQAALDAAAPAVVHVPAGLYRCDGVLTVTNSGVVLRGEGTAASRVYFTRHTSMTGNSHLKFRGSLGQGPDIPLVQDEDAGSFEVRVNDASSLGVGADVVIGWTITPEFIDEHGMTGTWQAFNGTWQVFFRRAVEAIDTSTAPHRVTLDVPLRYPTKMRDGASLRLETGHLSAVGVVGLGLSNVVGWDQAWTNERVHVLELEGVKDAFVSTVASFASPLTPTSGPGAGAHLQNGGIHVERSKRVTVAACRMERAQHRGGGGCGYLFEILQCAEILTRDCVAVAGRHNFIQNWGFGTTGCVWLRCHTLEGFAISVKDFPTIGQLGLSEFHHSIATANAIDHCRVDDGWGAQNRNQWSTGAGHSATRNVFWNISGEGVVRSRQFAWGYVIGTHAGIGVETSTGGSAGAGTSPEDWTEGVGQGAGLQPVSLYEAQFRIRTGTDPESAVP